jgi:hypothetical protein
MRVRAGIEEMGYGRGKRRTEIQQAVQIATGHPWHSLALLTVLYVRPELPSLRCRGRSNRQQVLLWRCPNRASFFAIQMVEVLGRLPAQRFVLGLSPMWPGDFHNQSDETIASPR